MTALVVMVAVAGAGKSTWVARRFTPTQTVNLDTLRAVIADDPNDQGATADAVAVQDAVLAARCRRRLLTVVDATNLRADVRAKFIEHAHRNLMLPVAVVLDVPLNLCLIRNRQRERRVPDDVIVRMHKQLTTSIPPTGGVPGFGVTRRIGDTHDYLAGTVPPGHNNAVWLR